MEGDSFSKLSQIIRELGYSKPVNIELATVIESPPNLRIKLDAEGLELEKDDLIVSKHLTEYKRKVTLESSTIEGATEPAGEGPHTHDYETMAIKDGTITFESLLNPGTRVLVACLDEDMVYVILDEAVWY